MSKEVIVVVGKCITCPLANKHLKTCNHPKREERVMFIKNEIRSGVKSHVLCPLREMDVRITFDQ